MSYNSLFLDTPLSKAVLKFFNHIEGDVLQRTSQPGAIKAYIFGGCAFHIHTNARGSNDIDVEFNSAKWITGQDLVFSKQFITYQDEGLRKQVSLDHNFTPMLGPLHEDYADDAIQLQTRFKDSPLWLYVVTAEDLAISKLGRYSERDRSDILMLLNKKKMNVDFFEQRATEAINYYVGNTSVAMSHLRQVVKMYKDSVKK